MKHVIKGIAGAMLVSVCLPAQAGDMERATKLLEEQQAIYCTLNDPSASTSDKMAGQKRMMAMSGEIASAERAIAADTAEYANYRRLQAEIGNRPCAAKKADPAAAKAASKKADQLVADLGKNLCAYNKSSDPMQQVGFMMKADAARRGIKEQAKVLRSSGDDAGAKSLEDRANAFELKPTSGC